MENKSSPPLEPLMDNGLVEVKTFSQQTNAWYDGYLLDVFEVPNENTEDSSQKIMTTVVLAVDGEPAFQTISQQKHIQSFPLDQIRFKPKSTSPVNFVANNIVEVRTVEKVGKYIAWKLAKIKKCRDTDAVIEYFDNDGKIIDTNSFDELDVIGYNDSRAPNTFEPFSGKTNPFVRLEIPTPFYRQNDFPWLNANLYSKFKNVANLINIHYSVEKNSLICLGFIQDGTEFSTEKFINQCDLLSKWHFRALKETHSMFKNLPMPANVLLPSGNSDESVLNLQVSKEYIGLAIGKAGLNISKARNVDGIKSIELYDEMNTFQIRGTSAEACKNAASILNYRSVLFEVDKERKDFFANKGIIYELIRKSNLIQINVVPIKKPDETRMDNKNSNDGYSHEFYSNNNNEEEEDCEIYLVGNDDSIANFKVMFEYQFCEQNEIFKLKQQFQGLMGTVRPRTNERRPPLLGKRRSGRNFADVVKS